jgi:hypothetical protein
MHVTHAVRLLAVSALAFTAGCGGAPTSSATLATIPQSAGAAQGQVFERAASGATVLESAARVAGVRGIPQPAHRPGGWLSPQAKSGKGLIYVSDFTANVVQIYPATGSNPAPIGKITDGISGPEGSYVDKHGNVFVSNVTNFTVTEYPQGSTTWSLRYTGLAYPTNVTVDSKGEVYIPDLVGNKVVEYPKNSTRSKRTISVMHPQGVAVDASGNLFVSYNGASSGEVDEYAPGSTTGTNLGIVVSFAGGDAEDTAGNLLLDDQSAPAVDVFPPGATTPSRTITASLQDPFRMSLDKGSQHLYVADPEANALFVYDYASGTLVNTITNGLTSVYGVAVSAKS